MPRVVRRSPSQPSTRRPISTTPTGSACRGRRRAAGQRDHPRDHRPRLPAHRRGPRLRGAGQRLLSRAQLPRVRQAVQAAHRRARRRDASRGRAGQRRPARLRVWKAAKPGEATILGQPMGQGPPGLAHRMLGHGPALPGGRLRHPRRRPRPDLPPPRERDRPGRGRRPALRPRLDAQRHDPRRGREDGQVGRQHLPAARGARALPGAGRAHLLPDDPLPQPARVLTGEARRGRGGLRAPARGGAHGQLPGRQPRSRRDPRRRRAAGRARPCPDRPLPSTWTTT